jgi:hypothetical protein
MATFTARQATKGRTIVLTGPSTSGIRSADGFLATQVTTHTVADWEPQGNGMAGLVDTRGQWCGIYGPGHLFADTSQEATALAESHHSRHCC